MLGGSKRFRSGSLYSQKLSSTSLLSQKTRASRYNVVCVYRCSRIYLTESIKTSQYNLHIITIPSTMQQFIASNFQSQHASAINVHPQEYNYAKSITLHFRLKIILKMFLLNI
jgi:hypothetical protein